jgi:hypothetical protein
MKRLLTTLMAVASLAIAAHAWQYATPERSIPWINEPYTTEQLTGLAIYAGEHEALFPSMWYPDGDGRFSGISVFRTDWPSYDETLYLEQQTYIEAVRVRLGGYRYFQWNPDGYASPQCPLDPHPTGRVIATLPDKQ